MEAKENIVPLKSDKRSRQPKLRNMFRMWAQWMSQAMGSPGAFAVAVSVVAGWGLTGPLFHYSDTWQLVINTATTIVTFLMVFLIQNTQNRDTKAIHLKLDELLRGVQGARTTLVNLENLSDEELDALQREFDKLRNRAQRKKEENRKKAFSPDENLQPAAKTVP